MAGQRRRGFAPWLLAAALLPCWAVCAEVTEPNGYWTGDIDAAVPAGIRGGTVVHARELAALLKKAGVVLVDASNAARRPEGLAPGAPWMPLAHRGLPGALWIPGAGRAEVGATFDAFFRGRLGQVTAGDLGHPLVLYCHQRCWLSWNAAKRALQYGYRRVYWFPEGIEGWRAAHLPTVVLQPEAVPDADADVQQPLPRLVVLDMELSGDLGGPEFAAEHEARLKMASARLREDIERLRLYQLTDTAPAQQNIQRLTSQQAYLHDCNGCDLDIGRQLGANQVFLAWVNRVSGLILTLTYEIHDVATGQILARKSFDFRGDNDTAWRHAIDYLVRDLREGAAQPGN